LGLATNSAQQTEDRQVLSYWICIRSAQ